MILAILCAVGLATCVQQGMTAGAIVFAALLAITVASLYELMR